MPFGSIAHLSDLHIGASRAESLACEKLCETLLAMDVGHVVVTGDVTENGRAGEYAEFNRIFAPLRGAGKLTVVPGNHDRLGDDVGREIMDGTRVDVTRIGRVSVVRVDTTGWHNRFSIAAHGFLDPRVLGDVDRAVDAIPKTDLIIVAHHHHLLRLPLEGFLEHLSHVLWLPFADALRHGPTLLRRLRGRADLVFHGHRHVPAETHYLDLPRPLRVFNAGSSSRLGRFRLFEHADGKLVGDPSWVRLEMGGLVVVRDEDQGD